MVKQLPLLLLALLSITSIQAQQMDYEKNLEILKADYGTCYNIGNYMLCPDTKVIRVGQMFGTGTRDCFGYFPDSTLQYDKEIMVIFAGEAFLDKRDLNIDWQSIQLLSYRDGYAQFTDGKSLYHISGNEVRKIGDYDKNTYIPYVEKPAKKSTDRKELGEYFYVKNKVFYYDKIRILEPFDVPNLRIITSKSGHETSYATDGKQVIFCGPTGGYTSIEKNGKEYVVVKDLIIEGVDLPSLRVLGKNLLADKNCLYYRTNIIPFNKLNGFKFNIRELE